MNLAELLIPKYESQPQKSNITINLIKNEDPRLHKQLSIAEFITAFGRYKRVMCQRLPERCVELDRYEANVVDIHNVYGSKFYDYHCQFAARAAIALRDNNIKIDWSVRDLGLLMMVVGNATANKCLTCSSTMHLSAFCPHVQQNIIPVIGQSVQSNPITRNHPINDKYGRPRTLVNNKKCETI